MKGKLLKIFMVVSFIAGISYSCGLQGDKPLVIWHDKEDEVIDVIKEEIEKKLPDEKVTFIRKENLTDNLKLVGNDPKSAPDMYIFAHDKIGLFATIGILEPMANLISEEALDDYYDFTTQAVSYDGVLYGLPLYFETLLFMYNKEKMDVPPSTTEQLYDYMASHTDSRRYGFVEQHSTPYYSAGWINGFGGEILNNDGTPGLTDEKTEEALEYHKKFITYMPKGSAEYATVNTLFTNKSADSIIGGPWLVPSAREAGIDLGIASMPTIDPVGQPIEPYAGIQGIQVLKVAVQDEAKKERIENLLKVFLEPELQANLALTAGCAPANEKAYDLDEIKDNELVQAIKDAGLNALPMPNRPEMDVMWTVLGNLLSDINIKGLDVKESCEKYQEEAERLIALMK